MAKTTKKIDVYQMVADRIMSEMENGIIPWQQPWSGIGNCVSYESGKAYSMLNSWLLREPGEYITCNQCNKLGGTVKKGAKSKFVVFHKKSTWTEKVTNEEGVEEEVEHSYFTLKYYNVFNIKDCEGIEPKWHIDENSTGNLTVDEGAEKIVTDYETRENTLKIVRDKETNDAFFSPSRDLIEVPAIGQYENLGEYYSTLYHEMVHSTGVKTRCDRGLDKLAAHGKNEYSQEELVAEMGSAMLVNRAGLDAAKSFKNSVAYLQSWLKVLKNDKKMLVVAAARAEKAVKYILNEAC